MITPTQTVTWHYSNQNFTSCQIWSYHLVWLQLNVRSISYRLCSQQHKLKIKIDKIASGRVHFNTTCKLTLHDWLPVHAWINRVFIENVYQFNWFKRFQGLPWRQRGRENKLKEIGIDLKRFDSNRKKVRIWTQWKC